MEKLQLNQQSRRAKERQRKKANNTNKKERTTKYCSGTKEAISLQEASLKTMILGRSLRDPRGFTQEALQLCKTTPEVIPLAPRREVNLFLIQRFMKSASKVPRRRGTRGGRARVVGGGGWGVKFPLSLALV